jgi:hypothetical protein
VTNLDYDDLGNQTSWEREPPSPCTRDAEPPTRRLSTGATGGAIWNNDGDTAFVLDHNGNIVHTLSYVPSTITTTTVATTQTNSGGD